MYQEIMTSIPMTVVFLSLPHRSLCHSPRRPEQRLGEGERRPRGPSVARRAVPVEFVDAGHRQGHLLAVFPGPRPCGEVKGLEEEEGEGGWMGEE